MTTFEETSTCLSPPFSYLLHKELRSVVRFFPLHMNYVCILFNQSVIDAGISVTKARWVIFEIAREFKTTILLSIVKILGFHNFKMF